MKNTKEKSYIAKSMIKNMPVSPRRVQLVANFIRGKKSKEMLTFLTFDNRKASKYVLEVLKTAIANAVNMKSSNPESLVIKDVSVGKGLVLKNRGVPGARGRFKPMKRRSTNLGIYVSEATVENKKIENVKNIKEGGKDE